MRVVFMNNFTDLRTPHNSYHISFPFSSYYCTESLCRSFRIKYVAQADWKFSPFEPPLCSTGTISGESSVFGQRKAY